jgi:hypothetical protein
MNARLRESYLEMGEDNGATVAPCGAAWYQMSVQNNTFWNGLYSGDGSHPSNWGTYLNACVFYATIFRQSPVGIPYYSSIGQQDAEDLQQLAEDIVLDSLSNWYIGHADVDSDASESMTGPFEYDFAANSQNATDHFWDFGDGQTSTDENPSHIFPTGVSATYEVMHVASSLCGSDTTYLNVTTSPSGIGNYYPLDELEIYTQAKSVVITNDLNCELNLSVLDLSGRTVKTELVGPRSQSIIELSLTSGVYLIRLENQNNASTRKVVLR